MVIFYVKIGNSSDAAKRGNNNSLIVAASLQLGCMAAVSIFAGEK